jgi:hypothetical protein
MRRFFLFAVLWTALFGPGHVLAACPMASDAGQGTHAPCHEEGGGATTKVAHGHDCCAWLAPSGASGKFFTSKSDAPVDDLAAGAFVAATFVAGHVPSLTHPPPLRSPSYTLRSAALGGDTFLRTGRLRL